MQTLIIGPKVFLPFLSFSFLSFLIILSFRFIHEIPCYYFDYQSLWIKVSHFSHHYCQWVESYSLLELSSGFFLLSFHLFSLFFFLFFSSLLFLFLFLLLLFLRIFCSDLYFKRESQSTGYHFMQERPSLLIMCMPMQVIKYLILLLLLVFILFSFSNQYNNC